jgi:DtxR family Mn-dependent transcriptional regulator
MTSVLLLFTVVLALIIGWRLSSRLTGFLSHLRKRRSRERVIFEDSLKHLYKSEMENTPASVQSLAGQLNINLDKAAEVLSRLQERGLVQVEGTSFQLLPPGREYALRVIRAHRLWERYLADETGVAEVEWHGRAEQLEHEISPEEADALWARLGHPTHDPHGDPLPTAGGLESSGDLTLLSAKKGQRARVIHVEDEPPSIYARLVEQGIFPGMELQVLEIGSDRIRILAEGIEKEIELLAAANVTLAFFEETETDLAAASRLSELKPGEEARVALLSKASRAIERRRFMDLGILPGTLIRAELRSPGGDPVAYRVRGALLALRKEQADHILVHRSDQESS